MIFRRFREPDRPGVLTALRESFDGWHGERGESYWTWKFQQNPHGPAHIWVADDDGTIAGCYVWNPVRLNIADATVAGAQSVDAAVHPGYRGRGVFGSLVRLAIEEAPTTNIDLVYAFPTEAAFRGQCKEGFASQFVLPRISRPVGVNLRRRRSPKDLVLRDVEFFDASFGTESMAVAPSTISVHRDPEYLTWRYLHNPVRKYEVVSCERSGQIVGYAILRIDKSERLSRGYFIDFQMNAEDESAAAFLVNGCLQKLRTRGIIVAESWYRPYGIEQDSMRDAGFTTRYKDIVRLAKTPVLRALRHPLLEAHFISLAIGPGLEMSADKVWSITPGDADYM